MERIRPLSHVVVDTNSLRIESVINPLPDVYSRTGQQILLPWTSTYELTKGSGNNFIASTRLLTQEPKAIAIAHESMQLYKSIELPFGTLARDLTNHHSTENLQRALLGLRDGTLQPEDMSEGLEELKRNASDLVERNQYPLLFRSGAEGIARNLPSHERTRIRTALDAGDRSLYRALLRETFSQDALADSLRNMDVPWVKARRLARMPSFGSLMYIASAANAFLWALYGGWQNTKRSFDNEGIDIENVLIALYGNDFVSKDGEARELYLDLRALIPMIWP